jgi:hypothetical protein
MKNKILIGIAILIIGIQFIPRHKNTSPEIKKHPLFTSYPTSHTVENIIRWACADCHSNHTNAYWYSNIQPLSMLIGNHVEEGKEHFNIDEWNNYPPYKQYHKIEECIEVIDENEMPLSSYTWMHENAKLNDLQKHEFKLWAKGLLDSMENRYEPNQLKKPKK